MRVYGCKLSIEHDDMVYYQLTIPVPRGARSNKICGVRR
jgi:hypothetical protein